MAVSTATVCPHPGFLKELCLMCGRRADDDTALVSSYSSAVRIEHLAKDMRLSKYEIALLKAQNTKNLLGKRKLILVLDLDHTLLHLRWLHDKDPDEVHDLLDQAENSFQCEFFHLGSFGCVTKLRLFVRIFLEEANNLFEMYVYTMGTRHYASTMVSLLDPKGVYFASRVISIEDCTKPLQKRIDAVLGEESAVLIIDNRPRAWPDHIENLIHVTRYKYVSPKNGEKERWNIVDGSKNTEENTYKVLYKV